jgi:hypothetical protein
MTRFSAAAAISIFLTFISPLLANAQLGRDTAPLGGRTADNTFCDGGAVTDGRCACPAGFELMPNSDPAGGGTCVKTHTENCLGGELTVDGKCLCNGRVVMSGETYLLEYSRGKCLPKQCPVQTLLKDGKCVATSASSPAASPDLTGSSPAPPRQAAQEPATEQPERRNRCGRGTVRARSGCAVAHRRFSRFSMGPGSLRRYYYRMYRFPAYGY